MIHMEKQGLLSQQVRPDSDVLSKLQTIAHSLIKRAEPVRFSPARDDAQRTAIYRQRYDTIIERGWGRLEDYPLGLERDEYDQRAFHIAGVDGSTLAASARMVFPMAGLRLPTEQAFDIVVEPQGQVVDLSRQIVAHAYSSNQHTIFSGLLAYCWLEAQSKGYYFVCGDFTPAVIRLYRRLGLQVTVIGESRRYWGEERMPIVVDVLVSVNTLARLYLDKRT